MTEPKPPSTTPTAEERLDAMEFLLGEFMAHMELESIASRARAQRLEAALRKIAPQTLAAAGEEEDVEPFTVDGLASWMQMCVERMRAHQATTARFQVALGELVLAVTGNVQPADELPPHTARAVHAAVEKAKRPPPAR